MSTNRTRTTISKCPCPCAHNEKKCVAASSTEHQSSKVERIEKINNAVDKIKQGIIAHSNLIASAERRIDARSSKNDCRSHKTDAPSVINSNCFAQSTATHKGDLDLLQQKSHLGNKRSGSNTQMIYSNSQNSETFGQSASSKKLSDDTKQNVISIDEHFTFVDDDMPFQQRPSCLKTNSRNQNMSKQGSKKQMSTVVSTSSNLSGTGQQNISKNTVSVNQILSSVNQTNNIITRNQNSYPISLSTKFCEFEEFSSSYLLNEQARSSKNHCHPSLFKSCSLSRISKNTIEESLVSQNNVNSKESLVVPQNISRSRSLSPSFQGNSTKNDRTRSRTRSSLKIPIANKAETRGHLTASSNSNIVIPDIPIAHKAETRRNLTALSNSNITNPNPHRSNQKNGDRETNQGIKITLNLNLNLNTNK